MYRKLSLLALFAFLPYPHALADPIHSVADGAYWHHDSGWVFPEKIGDYERVGIPQDVAGSPDAVAYYACIENGVRMMASVDVYLAKSAAAAELESRPESRSMSDGAFPLTATPTLSGTRHIYEVSTGTPTFAGLYFIDAGEWRVRIRIAGFSVEAMDAFARGQRWESLGSH